MELKLEENKETTKFESNSSGGFNDPLAGAMDFDTPYQISSTTVSKKKSSSNFLSNKTIIIVGVIIILAMIIIPKIIKLNKYNGTYELAYVEAEGYSYTVEQFETLAGFDIYGVIEVKGSRCKVDLDFTFLQTSGSAKIEFKGNKVTLTGNGTLEFKYDPDEKTIIYEVDGGRMIFEKVD